MALLKEISAFYNLLWKIPSDEREIIVYSERESYYAYFEGIIEELINNHKQTICYVTSDPDDPILDTTEPHIKAFYLNTLLPFFMIYVNCRVFAMTLTDLNQFVHKRSTNPVHYVYVFHSIVSTHMMLNHGAFEYYDTVLCVGPHQVEEIRKQEELYQYPVKKLVEAGDYRLERIYHAYQEYSQQEKSPERKATILIAPSWGTDNLLESMGEQLVKVLLEAGYEVIVRPHPETVRRFPEVVEGLASEFEANPDFTLERSVATDDSLIRADVMITDWSAVAFEYTFGTERPVLFFDVTRKVQNERYEELGIDPMEVFLRSEIGKVIPPDEVEKAPQVISKLIADRALFKERLVKLREKYIYAFGRSSEVGAQYIVDLVNKEADTK